jgi:hypothetical protein
MMAMEVLVFTRMEGTTTTIMVAMDINTTKEMATTIMATRVITITTLQEVMGITMEVIVLETTMISSRRILVLWSASSATRMDIMPLTALRRRRMMGTSQIHSRRDM